MPTSLDRVDQRELYLKLTPIELLRSGIETERLETIQLSQILTEQALVDPSHATELGASMKQRRGQLTPITVRARLNEEEALVYDVIDGFHRTEGRRKTGETDIAATVLYGCSDEEMFDLRILAASSVRSTQFARVANWITSSYANTPWSKKGLSVNSAFRIAYGGYGHTTNRAISDEDVAELKEWLKAKCDKWGRPIGTIRNELMLVSKSDPALVREVRNVKTAREAQTVITQRKLASVVNEFPGEPNFTLQRVILYYAVENKLNPGQIEGIVALLKGVIDPKLHEIKLREAVEKAHEALPKLSSDVDTPRRGRSGISRSLQDGKVVDDLDDDLGDTDVLDLESFLENDDSPENVDMIDQPEQSRSIGRRSLGKSTVRKGAFGQGDITDAVALKQRISDLENALEAAKNKEAPLDEYWWRTATYLTPTERICIERGIFAHEGLSALSSEMKMPVLQVFAHIRSAFAKRYLLHTEGRL